MKLIVTRVTNRAYQLSYRVMLWAYQNGESELLEHTLTNLLYYFDIAQAFDEGLMSVTEVSDLMDCQIVLDYILKEQTNNVQEKNKAKGVSANRGTNET